MPERLRDAEGVAIDRVLPDSPAHRAGLVRGIRIRRMGPSSKKLQSVKNLDAFTKIASEIEGPALLHVERFGYIALPAK